MRLAVDASVVVEACLSTAGFEPFDGHELVAPPLLWSETTSVLHEMRWRGDIGPDVVDLALLRLEQAPITRHDLPGAIRAAWDAADALGWAKTYDAEYVAIARALACSLLTIDGRMRRGVGDLVHVVGPMEIPKA